MVACFVKSLYDEYYQSDFGNKVICGKKLGHT